MEDKKIKYIKEFNLIPKTDEYIGWSEDVYIKENTIYNKENILIATVGEKDEVLFEEGYLEELQNLIEQKFNGLMDFEKLGLKDENREIYMKDLLKENDKEILELTEEELEEKLSDEEFLDEELFKEEKENSKDETEENLNKEQDDFSEEELIDSGNGWEEYSHIIKVKETDEIYKDLPDLEKPLFIGYDKSGNFVVNTIGENGEPVKSEVISESRSTMKEVIHIDDKGEQVKEMVPSAVMDTPKDNIKISTKIGQYGYIETQKLQISHENKWVATDIDRVGNYDKTYDVKYETDLNRHGECGNEEITENFERQQEEDSNIELDEIKHSENENIDSIKREIIDEALDNYEDMTREELNSFIIDNLNERISDDEIDIDKIAQDIKSTVEDEARFPTRGEKNN